MIYLLEVEQFTSLNVSKASSNNAVNAIISLNIDLKIDLKVAALLEISFRIYCIGYERTKVDKQTGHSYVPLTHNFSVLNDGSIGL
jgi:hypothetical protein